MPLTDIRLDCHLALHAKLGTPVGIHGAPVSLVLVLTVSTSRSRLPRLVKGLKVKDIGTPVEHAADAFAPEGSSIFSRGSGCPIVGAACSGPTGLAGPDFNAVD